MRVLVCGGRDFNDRALVARTLNERFYRVRPSEILIITGAAPGADQLAMNYADVRQINTARYPADWGRNGRRAGPIRNQKMLDEGKPDLVIAFPGGKGTADMVRRARAAGVEVIEASGDGYVAPAEKPSFRSTRRLPARATKKQKDAAIALFAPWPTAKGRE